MNTIDGRFSLAFLNNALTFLGPTPTYFSANSDAEAVNTERPVSPPRALTIRVLPQPGEPYNNKFLGISAPIAAYFSLLFKNCKVCFSLFIFTCINGRY